MHKLFGQTQVWRPKHKTAVLRVSMIVYLYSGILLLLVYSLVL